MSFEGDDDGPSMGESEAMWWMCNEGDFDEDDIDEDIPDDQAFDPAFDVPEDYTVWRTKDGRRIPVVEMTSDHLRRTIQVLRGKSPLGTTFRTTAHRRVEWVRTMSEELRRRGEPLPAVHSLSE